MTSKAFPPSCKRRDLIVGLAAVGAGLGLPGPVLAQAASGPAADLMAPNPAAFKHAMGEFIGSATPRSEGLELDIPLLADNPGAVPVKARVVLPADDSDWCEELIVLAELNPLPLACRVQFTADTGSAEAAVRLRLSQSQTVHVLARLHSGQVLAGSQEVTVAASGCGM